MFMYIFPIVLIVVSNIVYNVCQKSTPQSVNPFSAMLVTYLTAAILMVIAAQFYKKDKGFFQSFNDLNWTSVALGAAIVGLELGYLFRVEHQRWVISGKYHSGDYAYPHRDPVLQ